MYIQDYALLADVLNQRRREKRALKESIFKRSTGPKVFTV